MFLNICILFITFLNFTLKAPTFSANNVQQIQQSITNSSNNYGILEKTFGSQGTTYLTPRLGAADKATGIVVQSTGKIVVTGYVDLTGGGRNVFFAARFNNDGTLDSSFGNNGKYMWATPFDNGNASTCTCCALQSDNKILLGGYANVAGVEYFTVARLTENGFPDPFGGVDLGYFVYVDNISGAGTTDRLTSLVITPQGKIIGAGISNDQIAVIKINQDGSLDDTFGGPNFGPAIIPGTTYITNPAGITSAQDISVGLQSNGNIVLSGSANTAGGPSFYYATSLSSNGSLRTNFGSSGKITFNINNNNFNRCLCLTVDYDDAILLGGASTVDNITPPTRAVLVKLTPNGALDTSFGSSGISLLGFNIAGGTSDSILSLKIVNNNIIACGNSLLPGGTFRCAWLCFAPNGALNTNFGIRGVNYLPNTIAGADSFFETCTGIGILNNSTIIFSAISNNYIGLINIVNLAQQNGGFTQTSFTDVKKTALGILGKSDTLSRYLTNPDFIRITNQFNDTISSSNIINAQLLDVAYKNVINDFLASKPPLVLEDFQNNLQKIQSISLVVFLITETDISLIQTNFNSILTEVNKYNQDSSLEAAVLLYMKFYVSALSTAGTFGL